MLRDPARAFRFIAIAEAGSWLGLLIGMLFKRVIADNPIGVQVFGPIHGVLFLAYLGAVLVLARRERWPWGRLLVGAAAAVPPFTSVLFERWAARRRTRTASATPTQDPVGATAP